MLRPSLNIVRSIPIPSPHIPDVICRDVVQSDIAKHLRDPRAARSLRAGRGGDRGERGLARQRRLVGALDVLAGGAHPFVREEGVDHGSKL